MNEGKISPQSEKLALSTLNLQISGSIIKIELLKILLRKICI